MGGAEIRSGLRISFHSGGDFSSLAAPKTAGTFVPIPDCFYSRGDRRGRPPIGIENRGCVMLSWVVTFLIIALIAGILGFGGIAGVSIEIAKVIFFIAVVLFLISAVVGLARGSTRV
jgi:uncharacterized membrane protein YtjA (UPF0391 family)